jgi:hypothetical protein
VSTRFRAGVVNELQLVIDASTLPLLLMVLTGRLASRERAALIYLIEENRCL